MQPLQQLAAIGWDLSIPKGILQSLPECQEGTKYASIQGLWEQGSGKECLEKWLQLEAENGLVGLRIRGRIAGQCWATVLMPRETALCRAYTAPGRREVQLICPPC